MLIDRYVQLTEVNSVVIESFNNQGFIMLFLRC